MRFVQVKSAEQQSQLMLHRTRDLLMRQRTQVINALRAHMAELGITAAQGNAGLREFLAIIAGVADERLPAEAHASLIVLAAELQAMRTLIASIEKRIIAQYRSDEASKRLRSIPGIGLVGATAIVATITDPKAFRSGRDMAAWIGLVPRQDSTWLHPNASLKSQIPLAPRAPSIHGPSLPRRPRASMSVIGGLTAARLNARRGSS